MKTHVMGKIVTNIYGLDNGKDKGEFGNKFIRRPSIEKKDSKVECQEICSYEGEARTSRLNIWNHMTYINLSETEEVMVEKQIFRADLGDYFQYTDKVIEEINKSCYTNSDYCDLQISLIKLLKEYNKYMIENDDQAKAYCDLHKLNYEETDYDELLKVMGRNDEIKPTTVDLTLPSYMMGRFLW